MTRASQPHVLCDAVNLMVDPRHMLAAPCLKHRPNYLCNFGTTYNRYLPGAFGVACTSAIKSIEEFPKDHLQDIMDSMARITPETAAQVNRISCSVRHLHSVADMHALLLCVAFQQNLQQLHNKHQMCDNREQLLCCTCTNRVFFDVQAVHGQTWFLSICDVGLAIYIKTDC